jgi:hypothetical protein
VAVLQNAEEDFLHQVFAERPVARKLVIEIEQRHLIALKQLT